MADEQAREPAHRAAQVLDVFRAYENQVRNSSDTQRLANDLARAGVTRAPQAAARDASARWMERIDETAQRAAKLGVPRHLLDQYASSARHGFATKEQSRRAALASAGVSVMLDAAERPERPLQQFSAARLAVAYVGSLVRQAETRRAYHANSTEATALARMRRDTAQRERQAIVDELRARMGLNRPSYSVAAQPFAGQRAAVLSPERAKQRQQEAQAAVQALRGRQTTAPARQQATVRRSPLAEAIKDVRRIAPVAAASVLDGRGPDPLAMVHGWGASNRPPDLARPYQMPARVQPTPITPEQKAAAEAFRQNMVRQVERAEAGRRFSVAQQTASRSPGARYDVSATAAAARDVARAWIASKGKAPIQHDQVREVAKQSMERGRSQ